MSPRHDEFLGAVIQDDVAAVQEFLKRGAFVDERDIFGATPLMEARSVEMARLLLDYGAKINVVDDCDGTPLINAATKNRSEIVALLLERKANINDADESGFTALMCAAMNGGIETVRVLIENGADTTLRDLDGETAAELIENSQRFSRIDNTQEILQLLKDAPEIQRRRAEDARAAQVTAEAHDVALKNQQVLKAKSRRAAFKRHGLM